jgi:hypothetical protein
MSVRAQQRDLGWLLNENATKHVHSPLALRKQVVPAINVDDAVLEDGLPLVLDARDLVVHAEHNVHLSVLAFAILVVQQVVVAVVELRVNDLVTRQQTRGVGLGFRLGLGRWESVVRLEWGQHSWQTM